MKNIAILGAGISGLTAAFLLKKKGHKVTVFEKSHRAGGYIGTVFKDKFIVEIGANGFLNNEPKTLDLINQLNLHNELISAKEDSKNRFLMFDGKVKAVPNKPQELLKSDLISLGSKLKVLKETWFPPKPFSDISKKTIHEFFENHFGQEIAENLVRTALVGIYAGDTKKLSIEKTLKKLIQIEKEHHSLIKGLKVIFQKNGKSTLMSFKKGMQTLIDKLVSELKSEVKLSHEVVEISRPNSKFNIKVQNDETEETFEDFDDVVIALPPDEIPKLLIEFLDPKLFSDFKKFPVAPVRTLTFAFKEKIKFSGFGTLISPNEKLNILGFLHPKDIFEGRCPPDRDLFTVMMGGVFKPEVIKMSTQASVDLALKDLEKILGNLPAVENFWIWNHVPGISQYNVDQVDFLNALEQKFTQIPGLHLNSQMVGGVAVNDCIRKSFDLANSF